MSSRYSHPEGSLPWSEPFAQSPVDGRYQILRGEFSDSRRFASIASLYLDIRKYLDVDEVTLKSWQVFTYPPIHKVLQKVTDVWVSANQVCVHISVPMCI